MRVPFTHLQGCCVYQARVEDRRIAADAQRQVAETRMQEVQAERDQLQLRISALLEEV